MLEFTSWRHPHESAPTSGHPYLLWEVPGKADLIQLYFDVIDRMYPDIMRGLGALRRRGAEVGGISWADRIRLAGQGDCCGFQARAIEYLTGPSYNLSDNDGSRSRRRSRGNLAP